MVVVIQFYHNSNILIIIIIQRHVPCMAGKINKSKIPDKELKKICKYKIILFLEEELY